MKPLQHFKAVMPYDTRADETIEMMVVSNMSIVQIVDINWTGSWVANEPYVDTHQIPALDLEHRDDRQEVG
jgi:hypothetical protein